MKIRFKHSISIVSMLLLFSCYKADKDTDVFDEPLEVRVQQTLQKYRNALTSSEFGWVLNYQSKPEFGAFKLLLKFNSDQTLEITSDFLSGSLDLPTTWRVSKTQIPELVIESFTVFHHLFEADNFINQAEFEFFFEKIEENNIELKSKTDTEQPTILKLRKATEEDKERIITIRNNDTFIENNYPESTCFRLIQTKNEDGEIVFEGNFFGNNNNRTAAICSSKDNEPISKQFVLQPTTDGFKVLNPFEINGVSFKDFKYDSQQKLLVSTNNGYTTTIYYSDLPSKFCVGDNSQNNVFQENFTTHIPTTWDIVNASSPVGTTDFQWVDSFGGIIGSYYSSSDNSQGSKISNWIISPPVNIINGDLIKFWVYGYTQTQYVDRLEVRIAVKNDNNSFVLPKKNNPDDIGDFSTVVLDINPEEKRNVFPTYWEEMTIKLEGFSEEKTNVRIAFRHLISDSYTNGNGIFIDNLRLLSISCEDQNDKKKNNEL